MIVKFRKTPGHFITIDRAPIDEDATISFKAKGILTYLMGRPDDWKPRIVEIASHTSEKKESVRTGVKELQKAGYIELRRIKDEKTNRWAGWEWRVTDTLLQTSLPCEGSPKPKKRVTDESTKPKNRVSGEVPVNGENEESPKPNYPYYGKSDLLLKDTENKKDQELKRREREDEEQSKVENELSKKSPLPSLSFYLSFFSLSEQTLFTQEELAIFAKIDNRQAWQKACQDWKEKCWNIKNLSGLFDRYTKHAANGHGAPTRLSEEPPSSYVERPEPPQKLTVMTDDERAAMLKEGERKTREYFQKKGWKPADIEKQVRQIRQAIIGG